MHHSMNTTSPHQQQVIISLTSFPAALSYAAKAIRSILRGSMMPDRIILYLDTQQFPDGTLPEVIEDIKGECPFFEVRFSPANIRSYKKLVPALEDFPDDIIVTIDDDINYHPNMLRDLVRTHKRVPNAIIAHRVRKIKPGQPYSTWKKYKWKDFILRRYHFTHLALQTGVGGVLYPPHSLDEEMMDPTIFTQLAPTQDDIWFWAAAVSKGTFVVPIPFGKSRAIEVGKPRELSLKRININPNDDRNRKAFDNILAHYPHIKQRLQLTRVYQETDARQGKQE